MYTVAKSNQLAIQIMKENKYRYLYGGKDQPYTKKLALELAKKYPSVYTSTITALALEDADKGYLAIDCSGFVCKVLDIPTNSSAGLRQTAIRLPLKKENAKPGMAIWTSGHVGYVGEGLKIYEARGTAKDLTVVEWDKRASGFSELLIVKGSALYEEAKKGTTQVQNSSTKKENPYTKPTKLVCSAATAKSKKYTSDKYVSTDKSAKSVVKWVQFELNEAGCYGPDGIPLDEDGIFGSKSDYALRKFQASCKITVDGVCGPTTIKYLDAK